MFLYLVVKFKDSSLCKKWDIHLRSQLYKDHALKYQLEYFKIKTTLYSTYYYFTTLPATFHLQPIVAPGTSL